MGEVEIRLGSISKFNSSALLQTGRERNSATDHRAPVPGSVFDDPFILSRNPLVIQLNI